jgi:hypothetical protein
MPKVTTASGLPGKHLPRAKKIRRLSRRGFGYYTGMKNPIAIVGVLVALSAGAGGSEPPIPPCSAQWNSYVERQLVSGDGQGHGPDLGSDEWKGVIEFKLGVRGRPEVPARDSDAWCEYIDSLMRAR